MNTLTAGTDRVPTDTDPGERFSIARSFRFFGNTTIEQLVHREYLVIPRDRQLMAKHRSVTYIDGLRRHIDSFLVVDAHLTICTTCDGKGTIPCWMFPKHPLPCPDCSGRGV